MGRQRIRSIKKSVYIAGEGKREKAFLDFVTDLFKKELDKNNLIVTTEEEDLGGNPERRIMLGIIAAASYDYSIVLLDDDVYINEKNKKEIYKKLANCWCIKSIPPTCQLSELHQYNKKHKNPLIIISMPLNFESIIIQFLGKNIPNLKKPIKSENNIEKNKADLKNTVTSLFGEKTGYSQEYMFYKTQIRKKDCLQRVAKIPQLKEIFKILQLIK